MISPKAIDDAIVEEFNITELEDMSKPQQAAWVKAQIDEMKKAAFRSRINIILSENLMESEIEAIADKGRQNRTEARHEVKQFVSSVKVLNQYLAEIEK